MDYQSVGQSLITKDSNNLNGSEKSKEIGIWDLLIAMFSNIFTYSDYMLVTMVLNFMLVIT